MANTNRYLARLVEDRLAHIKFEPAPTLLKDAIVSALETKVKKLVDDTLKDWPSVLEFGKRVAPEAHAAQPKAPAAAPKATPSAAKA